MRNVQRLSKKVSKGEIGSVAEHPMTEREKCHSIPEGKSKQ